MANVPQYKMPRQIYCVVIHVCGQTHKYLTLGIGITEEDQIEHARKDAEKWARQYSSQFTIETPEVWA